MTLAYKEKLTLLAILAIFIILLPTCKSFKHGYTWDKAKDRFSLVTGDADNFGDKRLDYNKAFHRNSELSNFLECRCNNRGLPNLIYKRELEKFRGYRQLLRIKRSTKDTRISRWAQRRFKGQLELTMFFGFASKC